MIILLIDFTVRRSACLFTNIRDAPKPRQNLLRKSLDTHFKKTHKKTNKNCFAFLPIELFALFPSDSLSVNFLHFQLLQNHKICINGCKNAASCMVLTFDHLKKKLTWVSLLLNNKYQSFHIAHDHFLRQKLSADIKIFVCVILAIFGIGHYRGHCVSQTYLVSFQNLLEVE